MRYNLLFIFILGKSTISSAQDFTAYYQLVQRAEVAIFNENLLEGDSLYRLAFSKNLGFTDDYGRALFNNYRLTTEIDLNLLKLLFKTGTPWNDAKYDLSKMGVSNFSIYKKLYRKNRPNSAVNGLPVFRLLIRDMLHRSDYLDFLVHKNADSINFVKLQKLIVKKPALFDRTKTSWMTSEMLSILLIHQDKWQRSKELFSQLRELVIQGKINPLVIQIMIERASLFHGTFFELDSITGTLKGSPYAQNTFCGSYHYTALYGNYGRLYDKENRLTLLPPRSPQVAKSEINALRNYLFLLDVHEAFPENKYRFLTEDEYCTRMGKALTPP